MGEGVMDWKTMYPKPYSKHEVDPYTKVRIILMNGIEAEAIIFSHQFHRNCNNNERGGIGYAAPYRAAT